MTTQIEDSPVEQAAPAKKGIPIDVLVEKYIQLRDKKAELKKKFDADTADITAALDKAEGFLLRHFQETGVEAVTTKAGTAYSQLRTSAGIADWDSVLDFIRTNEMWSMLERRVSKTAVEAYKNEHADLPPGINWSEARVVNVRRS